MNLGTSLRPVRFLLLEHFQQVGASAERLRERVMATAGLLQGGEGASAARTAACVRQCANVGITLSSTHCRGVAASPAVRGSHLSYPRLRKLVPLVPEETDSDAHQNTLLSLFSINIWPRFFLSFFVSLLLTYLLTFCLPSW